MTSEAKERCRLVAVTLDEASIGRGNPDQEHERAIAIYDIVEANHFALPNYDGGPYALHIALVEKKLCFDIRSQDGTNSGRRSAATRSSSASSASRSEGSSRSSLPAR